VTWLRTAPSLSSNAAHAQATSGDVAAAARSLERGRAMLLSEALQHARADLGRLEQLGRGDLTDRYRAVADRVAGHRLVPEPGLGAR
jgi:hypothetical protein